MQLPYCLRDLLVFALVNEIFVLLLEALAFSVERSRCLAAIVAADESRWEYSE